MYRVFTRTWYKRNPQWPGGLEPHPGRKYILQYFTTRDQAYEYAAEWNKENEPGKLSRKAEFEKA